MKFIYVITILLCIYLLFSIFLKLFSSNEEGFENKKNSIVFDLYPKLNQQVIIIDFKVCKFYSHLEL